MPSQSQDPEGPDDPKAQRPDLQRPGIQRPGVQRPEIHLRQAQAPPSTPVASSDRFGGPTSQPESTLRAELSGLDRAIYGAVASTPTPKVDRALQGFTSAADHSKLWLASAAVLAVLGGPAGRRAALTGVASIGVASLVVNQGFKNANRRRRPDRDGAAVPDARRVPMPTSTSFPSGHSASAFAFAEGISGELPLLAVPIRLAATLVAYSRVHAGVHYPGDVVAGSLIGMACGELTPLAVSRARAIMSGR